MPSKRPATESLRGTVERRVAGKPGPVELSDEAAAQRWAENVLRWTGKRPTPLEVQQRKLQRVDRSKRTETSQPRGRSASSSAAPVKDTRMSAPYPLEEDVRMMHNRARSSDEEQEMEVLARSRSLDDAEDKEDMMLRISNKDPRVVASVETTGPPWHDEYTGLELAHEDVQKAMTKEMAT